MEILQCLISYANIEAWQVMDLMATIIAISLAIYLSPKLMDEMQKELLESLKKIDLEIDKFYSKAEEAKKDTNKKVLFIQVIFTAMVV